MKPLVLGYGLLGKSIVEQTGWDCVSRKKDGFNIEELNKFTDLLLDYDVIINCIADTNTYSKTKDSHWNINYKGVHSLIEFCNSKDIKLIHISTDFVYANNKKVEPTEDDVPVHAENWYAYTKLLGESLVQLLSKDYLICRCTHKAYPFEHKKAFLDRYSNVDYTQKIAKLIIDLVMKRATGVFNVGTERKSMFEFALESNPTVQPCLSPKELPKDTCMSLDKMKKYLYEHK